LFFFVLGPFIVILSSIFGFKNLKNQRFIPWTAWFCFQAIQYVAIFTFLLLLYLLDNVEIHFVEVYMLIVAVFIRIITICCKNAYSSEPFLELMKKTYIQKQDAENEHMIVHWILQRDEIVQQELQAAILQLEVESSLFFFEFIGKIPKELEKLLKKSYYPGKLGEIKELVFKSKENKNEAKSDNPQTQEDQIVKEMAKDENLKVLSPAESEAPLQNEATKNEKTTNREDSKVPTRNDSNKRKSAKVSP
jgi:hypothetical protein